MVFEMSVFLCFPPDSPGFPVDVPVHIGVGCAFVLPNTQRSTQTALRRSGVAQALTTGDPIVAQSISDFSQKKWLVIVP